ncbi:MAG: hypothetical protein HYS27_14590 [Deltaproteobacteria bacterium]|nr:hypothetical protein [Deltaproteobacteria bacterium]
MTHQPTEPTLALATATATAPRRAIDDPRQLDDEQLLELLTSFNARTVAVGAVGAAATAALAIALTPIAWFAGLALMPAAVAGFWVSNRAVQHAAAARLGVTSGCLRAVERAFDRVSRNQDVRTLKAADWVRTDYARMVKLVRAELERGAG